MKIRYLFIFLFVFFSCGKRKDVDPRQENAKYAYNFTLSFAAEIKQKFNLKLVGWGGSFYLLSTHFSAPFSYNENQTRRLLFQCADECLKMMNADPKMKTIKKKKPNEMLNASWANQINFDYSNVKLIIGFKDDKKEHNPPNINFASFSESGISYFTYDIEKQDEILFFQESIDQALEKIQSE